MAEHWASIPKVVGSNPTVARHIFQACPVWIYTQSSNYIQVTINFTGRVKFRWIFLISLLTRNSPCLTRKGILNQILGETSSEVSVPVCSVNWFLLKFCRSFSLRIIENRIFLLKPFQDINLVICAIYLFSNVELLQICTAR